MKYTHEYRTRIVKNMKEHKIGVNFIIIEGLACELDVMVCMDYKCRKMCIGVGDDNFSQLGQAIIDADYDVSKIERPLYYSREYNMSLKKILEMAAWNFLDVKLDPEFNEDGSVRQIGIDEIQSRVELTGAESWEEVDKILERDYFYNRYREKFKVNYDYLNKSKKKKLKLNQTVGDISID